MLSCSSTMVSVRLQELGNEVGLLLMHLLARMHGPLTAFAPTA